MSDPAGPQESPPPRERLESLDVFRGITIAAMLLVNMMGDRKQIYAQLDHRDWHGCTLTDLIFPFFLFIVGVSITLSFARRPAGAPVLLPVLRRAATLFLLGVLMNAVPFTRPDPVRIPGILQRIGVVYLVAALLAARTTWRTQARVAAALVVAHTAALLLIPVPEFGAGDLEKGHDLATWIDLHVLGGKRLDPEGLLSTAPAIATALLGVLAGRWLTSTDRPAHERTSGLFFAGVAGAAAGFAATAIVPLNKALWTGSYALFTGGLACQALAACHWLVDLQGVRRWTPFFLAFGRNPILAFWAAHALQRVLTYWPAPAGAPSPTVSMKARLYEATVAAGGSTPLTSAAWALANVLLWWAVVAALDRRRIYLKV